MSKAYKVRVENPGISNAFPHMLSIGERGDEYLISERSRELLGAALVSYDILNEINTDKIEGRIIYPYRHFLYSTPNQLALDEICVKLLSMEKDGTIPYAIFLGRNPDLEPGAFFLDTPNGNRYYQWKLSYTTEPEVSMAEMFPKLINTLEDKDTKVVLSFGGAGLRFFVYPTLIKFFEAIKVKNCIDEVWGSGSGALFGYLFAIGVAPEAIEQGGYDIYHDRHNLIAMYQEFAATKTRLFGLVSPKSQELVRQYATLKIAIRDFMVRLVGDKNLKIPFLCTPFSVNLGKNVIVSSNAMSSDNNEELVTQTDSIDEVVVSSAIPIVYVPKEMRQKQVSKHYIDGSIYDPVPLESVVNKWMINKKNGVETRSNLVIISVNCHPQIKEKSWLDDVLVKIANSVDAARLNRKLFDFMINQRSEENLSAVSKNESVNVLNISLPIKTNALMDCRAIPTFIQNAQTTLIDKMMEIEKALLK